MRERTGKDVRVGRMENGWTDEGEETVQGKAPGRGKKYKETGVKKSTEWTTSTVSACTGQRCKGRAEKSDRSRIRCLYAATRANR